MWDGKATERGLRTCTEYTLSGKHEKNWAAPTQTVVLNMSPRKDLGHHESHKRHGLLGILQKELHFPAPSFFQTLHPPRHVRHVAGQEQGILAVGTHLRGAGSERGPWPRVHGGRSKLAGSRCGSEKWTGEVRDA